MGFISIGAALCLPLKLCLCGYSCLGDSDGIDADALLIFRLPLELHRAIGGGEQRMIAAQADIGAGHDARATLAHDDGARRTICPRSV